MKRSVLFIMLITFVFSLSAQRLNSRGEKMVSHIHGEPMATMDSVHSYYKPPFDIYFYYDSNNEINKIKISRYNYNTDSIVITKGKNGIIWKGGGMGLNL